jgi:hypothetical protein
VANNDAYFDDAHLSISTISAIPVPSAFFLFISAFFGLSVMARRKAYIP